MPIRFPDQYSSLREVDGLSDTAYRLNQAALFWCNLNRTDGLIRREELDLVCARVRAPERFASECERWGTWHDARRDCGSEFCPGPFDADGWAVHDYLRYAPSRAEMEAQEAGMSGGGKRGNHRRWHEQRGIVSPGCEFCEGSQSRELPAASPVAKRTSGTRSGGDRVPDSGAIPIDRSDQDFYLGNKDQDQNPDQDQRPPPDRLPDRYRAPRVVALAVKALWKKSGQAISDDEALYAIAVLAHRATLAGTVIHDPVKYFPAAIRREADVFAELLPRRAVAPPAAEAPSAAPSAASLPASPQDPHAFVAGNRHAKDRCGFCAMPAANRKSHPPHLQARSA